MLTDLLCILLVIFLLMGAAYFAACETAMTACSKAKIFSIAKDGNKKAKVILELQKEAGLVLSSILMCNTILNSLAVSFANALCVDAFGESAIFYCPIIISIFIVLFAEVLPKMLTLTNPENILLPSAYFIKYTYRVSRPLNNIIGFIARRIIRIIKPVSEYQDEYTASLEELRGAIDLHTGFDIEETEQEKEMMQNILDLGMVPVGNIMVHRKNVTMLCADEDINTIVEQVMSCPFTRIPLWSEHQDNIIGILHVKDIFKAVRKVGSIDEVNIMDIALKPWFIPENNDLLYQLQSFRTKREHFAIVVDEYGSFMGIITLEDVIEEIVGDITDEHDVVPFKGIREQDDGSYVIDGSVNIRDLNREIGSKFRGDIAATLAGLVINSVGIIPDVGQVFILFHYKFEILRRQRNQVTLLRVTSLHENGDDDDSEK
ncbi:MAG: CNNM domain-containing protein [Holosporales bacterium]|jgi:Mg2+/Co2+ transporter CorB|nr:CNNM domain-containing protein [Holosporales bacterium]